LLEDDEAEEARTTSFEAEVMLLLLLLLLLQANRRSFLVSCSLVLGRKHRKLKKERERIGVGIILGRREGGREQEESVKHLPP